MPAIPADRSHLQTDDITLLLPCLCLVQQQEAQDDAAQSGGEAQTSDAAQGNSIKRSGSGQNAVNGGVLHSAGSTGGTLDMTRGVWLLAQQL